MSLSNSKAFKLSFLAAAVLSLSACSTTPTMSDVGNGLSTLGSKTAEIGSNAWEGTKNLLHIGPQDSELLDEVDLALMDEDTNMQSMQLASNDSATLLPQGDIQATLTDTLDSESVFPNDNTQQATTVFGQIPEQPATNIVELGETDTNQLVTDEVLAAGTQVLPGADTVPSEDMTHVVVENDTLWIIAKTTTGDANNWHVIADMNNLAPDASVRPGQKLIIPADLLKAVEVESVTVAQVEAEQLEAELPVLKIEQPAAVALNIPTNSTEKEVVVAAAAEQLTPAAPADAANIMTDATALKVGSGETLWDFSKRTTGDATNWKQIADKNMFDEKQLGAIRPGQKIYVPTDLVRSRDANGELIARGAEGTVPTATIGGAMPLNQEAIDASAAVLAGTNQPEGEIKIVEAAYQGNDAITPVTAESLSEEAAVAVAENDDKVGKVMVSGTYYPKAVYNEADFSSSLLMRVSPGTQLLVSKAIGPWLEVTTDKGVGYVHSRDIK